MVGDSLTLCDLTDHTLAGLGKCYDRGGGAIAFGVRNNDGLAAFHNGNAAVSRTKVDTNNLTHNQFLQFISRQVFYKFICFPPSGEFAFNLRP